MARSIAGIRVLHDEHPEALIDADDILIEHAPAMLQQAERFLIESALDFARTRRLGQHRPVGQRHDRAYHRAYDGARRILTAVAICFADFAEKIDPDTAPR